MEMINDFDNINLSTISGIFRGCGWGWGQGWGWD